MSFVGVPDSSYIVCWCVKHESFACSTTHRLIHVSCQAIWIVTAVLGDMGHSDFRVSAQAPAIWKPQSAPLTHGHSAHRSGVREQALSKFKLTSRDYESSIFDILSVNGSGAAVASTSRYELVMRVSFDSSPRAKEVGGHWVELSPVSPCTQGPAGVEPALDTLSPWYCKFDMQLPPNYIGRIFRLHASDLQNITASMPWVSSEFAARPIQAALQVVTMDVCPVGCVTRCSPRSRRRTCCAATERLAKSWAKDGEYTANDFWLWLCLIGVLRIAGSNSSVYFNVCVRV